MISTGFNESHFEFRVNQELYGFLVSSLDSSSRKTWAYKPKSCLYSRLSTVRKQNFTSLAAILKMAANR